MRLRRWISFVAMAGVLMHAGLIVRHGLIMADAARHQRALLADLAVLCHATSATERGDVLPAELPQLPRPSDATGCPVCAGLIGAFALVAPCPAALHLAHAIVISPAAAEDLPLGLMRLALPPARGPPTLA